MVQQKKFMIGNPNNMVCKLKTFIYGLKQASRQWYFKSNQVIASFNFKMNLANDCLYHKFNKNKYIFLILYVYDILLTNNDIHLLHDTKRFLGKNFEIKDVGDASFVLDIHVH